MTLVGLAYLAVTLTTLLTNGMFTRVITDFAISGLAGIAFMGIMFLIGRSIKRYDLVDAAWGMVFIVICGTSYFLQPGNWLEFDSQALVTLLVVLWGGRLAQHILKRIAATDQEDARYVELRKKWKGNVEFNILTRMYISQALLALIICIPVIHINLFADVAWSVWTFVGAVVWGIGFVFESFGDRQLRQFVTNKENRGKIMNRGLWKYSRHPNYFGELTQWWGIFIICLGTPFGWVGIIGPVLISYLILYVSGIPLNEKRFEGRDGWAEYKAKTSKIIPFPPKTA